MGRVILRMHTRELRNAAGSLINAKYSNVVFYLVIQTTRVLKLRPRELEHVQKVNVISCPVPHLILPYLARLKISSFENEQDRPRFLR